MDRAAFCCGEPELDAFFRVHALDHHDGHKARVTVGLHDGKVVGFYWLIAQSFPLNKVSAEAEHLFAHLGATPCVYLGMLGTQQDRQGNGIGKTMMLHAMRQTLAIAERLGVYALTLEAINERRARQYERWGFAYCVEGALDMYIALPTIRKAGLAPLRD